MKTEILQRLYCSNCGWNYEMAGMKNKCPDCRKYGLDILRGSKEEIDKFINDKKEKRCHTQT